MMATHLDASRFVDAYLFPDRKRKRRRAWGSVSVISWCETGTELCFALDPTGNY